MQCGYIPVKLAPSAGTIEDMEQMDLDEKLSYLRENKLLKCMNKNELLREHAETWKENGLSHLKYTELERTCIGMIAVRIKVDVELNGGHWSDERCGMEDNQF